MSTDIGTTVPRILIDPNDPRATARLALRELYAGGDRTPGLRRHREEFLRYGGGAYSPESQEAVEAALWAFLEEAHVVKRQRDGSDTVERYKPRARFVGEVAAALGALVIVADAIDPPAWLDREGRADATGGPDPRFLLPCANGVLDLRERRLLPATPRLFSRAASPVAFDPDATCPRWLAFLDEVLGDAESIDLLAQWFGYCLTADTGHHKLMLLVGAKRSGKGTIARVLSHVLGPDSVCSPTLASLGGEFGMAPLLGRLAAIVTDARLDGRTDQAALVAGLLAITGEDDVSVNRKFRAPVQTRLRTRFTIIANELPRLRDSATAFAERALILETVQSFAGREHIGLTDELIREAPGILAWAVDGLERLTAAGRFVRPARNAARLDEFERLTSPVKAFVDDAVDLGPGEFPLDDLYAAFGTWAEDEGRHHVPDKATFARDLKAACPGLDTSKRRTPAHERFGPGGGKAFRRVVVGVRGLA